ncbi:MAG TPA: protein-glutamate O-methyltransferase CheR [Polyangiaceae bacterium]|nr:protein-glutamate O-methyltransferase CheR [Polyangiaceae bacterium]
MSASVFNALRRLAYDQAGIAIRENKQTLVSARIAKRMRECGFTTERAYLEHLEGDASGKEMVRFLDAISTNFTSFFREPDHFEFLSEEVRRWIAEGSRQLRVWCAAAATGEEPYSLAMTLSETIGAAPVEWRLLASDISVTALDAASKGVYSDARLEPVRQPLRRKYFVREARGGAEPSSRASDELKRRILFKRLNLATPPFPLRGELDAVFCRNVMIYFDDRVRQRLVSEIERLLKPGGILVVAHSETLNGVRSRLRTLMPSVYRKVD